ncbi:MAG: SDR family oxidoreductase [Patescibacteria group bacterium]
MKKTYLVFGAAGSIGKKVVYRLINDDHNVIASVKAHRGVGIETTILEGVNVVLVDNVADREMIEGISNRYKLDGIIYAVGHCPPGGFTDATKYPLSQLPLQNYKDEIDMHQIGALNVFQCLLPILKDGGCFVFISSAITRLKGQFPPFLQAYHYASVISAEDWLVDGMRHDPTVIERKIKIHRIAPISVDTPFHSGVPKPPKMLAVDEVVDEIARALKSEDVVDKMML